MLYGNSSSGYSYSPDRSHDTVDHTNLHSQFIGASGSRQNGYYYSASPYNCYERRHGYYDGKGRWIED